MHTKVGKSWLAKHENSEKGGKNGITRIHRNAKRSLIQVEDEGLLLFFGQKEIHIHVLS